MTQTAKSRKELIKAATVSRVVSKSGEFLGYLVKSNSNENYYQVTWNESQKCYECNCAAKVKCCCHVKAISEVCQARIATQKAAQEQSKKQRWVKYNLSSFCEAMYCIALEQVVHAEPIQVVAANPEMKSLVKVSLKPHRYCSNCQCALPLKQVNGQHVCAVCAGHTKEHAPLQGRNYTVINGVPMR